MKKNKMFKILTKSSSGKVMKLADQIRKNHEVIITKEPSKTLVMLKMKEPVANAKYYLGELLACEAMVKIDDKLGTAVTAGDDFDKVLAMATIDAAFNSNVKEVDWLIDELEILNKEVERKESEEFSMHYNTKVNFREMMGE